VDYAVAIEYVQLDPESYQISEVMLTNEPIAVAIKSDNTELQTKINKAMEEIRADGTLKSISEEWLGGDYTSDIDEELNVVE
ncbi:MAG TPA: transporter substrate-binding domain-containing protein, partial [Proteiniclasticum sp.]|nr:transporter substrate-binding domain-containing protein [Proteiniclasticum sp.]